MKKIKRFLELSLLVALAACNRAPSTSLASPTDASSPSPVATPVETTPLLPVLSAEGVFSLLEAVSQQGDYRVDYAKGGAAHHAIYNARYTFSDEQNSGVAIFQDYADPSQKAAYAIYKELDGSLTVGAIQKDSAEANIPSIQSLSPLRFSSADAQGETPFSIGDLAESEDGLKILTSSLPLVEGFAKLLGLDPLFFSQVEFETDPEKNLKFTLVLSPDFKDSFTGDPSELVGVLSRVGSAVEEGIDEGIASYSFPSEKASASALSLLSAKKGEVSLSVTDHYEGESPADIGGAELYYDEDSAFESKQKGVEGSQYYSKAFDSQGDAVAREHYVTFDNQVKEKEKPYEILWEDFLAELTSRSVDSEGILKTGEKTYQLFSPKASELFYGFTLSSLNFDVKSVTFQENESGKIDRVLFKTVDAKDEADGRTFHVEALLHFSSSPKVPSPLTPYSSTPEQKASLEKAFSKVRAGSYKVDVVDSSPNTTPFTFHASQNALLKTYSWKDHDQATVEEEVGIGYALKDGKVSKFRVNSDQSVVNLTETPKTASDLSGNNPLFLPSLSLDVLSTGEGKIVPKTSVENVLPYLVPHPMASDATEYELFLDAQGVLDRISFSYEDSFGIGGEVEEKLTYFEGGQSGIEANLLQKIQALPPFQKPTRWSEDTPALNRPSVTQALERISGVPGTTIDDIPYAYFPEMHSAWGAYVGSSEGVELYVWDHPDDFGEIQKADIDAFVASYQEALTKAGYVLDTAASSETKKVYGKGKIGIEVRLDDATLSSVVKVVPKA